MWRIQTKPVAIQSHTTEIMDACSRRELGLLSGDKGAFSLAHLWIAHLAMQDIPVYVIDCAIRFQIFSLADEIIRHGHDVDRILSGIKIRRDFTPYQLLTTMNEILTHSSSYVYFILSPTKQFFDGDVGAAEGKFLLTKLLGKLSLIQQKRIPLVLVEKHTYHHPTFAAFFPKMQKMADTHWSLQAVEKKNAVYLKIQTSKKALSNPSTWVS